MVSKGQRLLEKDIQQKIAALAFDTHRVVIENTPVRTGRLRRSIVVEEEDGNYIVGTNVPYAEFVEGGTSRMGGRFMFLKGAKAAEQKLRKLFKQS